MKFLSRIFGRKPEPPVSPPDMRDMSEGWKVGDLAVCIEGPWFPMPGPGKGEINRVTEVYDGIATHGVVGGRAYFLRFQRYVGIRYATNCFRKIRLDAEPCEEEFTALIKRGRKLPKREHV